MLEEAANHPIRNGLAALTPRELEVLQMISLGLTNAEIKFHLAAIYSRLGVANRTEAAVKYLQASENGARAQSPALEQD